MWQGSTIKGIFSNEKYYGNAVLQKTITVDYLTHKKRNQGELPQYEVKGSHEAIILKEEFLQVQALINKSIRLWECS